LEHYNNLYYYLKMMKAYLFEKDKAARLQSVPMPIAGQNEALIKINRAGICNTDIEILKGYMGFHGVIGHEFVGTVVSVTSEDAADQTWVNQRVTGDINCACMEVSACSVCAQTGTAMARNHCPSRSVLGILGKDGTYAEYITLPIRNLHAVPDGVLDEEAVFVEPLAAACRIIEQKVIDASMDRVAVIGDGKLGLLIMEVLCRSGLARPPSIIGRHPEKMELLVRDGGSANVNMIILKDGATDLSPAPRLVQVTPREDLQNMFDVVIDATGSPAGLELSGFITRPLGTLVLKSTCAAGTQFNTAPYVIDELKIIGSRCGPFESAIELLASSTPKLNLKKYIHGVFPLEDVDKAIERAKEKGALKVQIVCSSP
jgi:threonine dehydrogenase-like Zn-dependent dehydrogenase